ncbi:hypothetical protein SCE1572_41540 [Sorangium cellulosum So0157-2]|uniref:Uncharacterized protein n=1 Tax=Sorangium cellulosum So0157-2 TaxID=1254432 RepID=S4Y7R2_SORCE|nr:hypothetical protein SCE1572_41540 [Sorangium cellulosum So0157-2]
MTRRSLLVSSSTRTGAGGSPPAAAPALRRSIAPSASATAAPSRGRSSGCFASMLAQSASSCAGSSGRSSRRCGGSSRSTLTSTASAPTPWNAARPVRHLKSTQPSANTSARASTLRSPRACSGAMYSGVPRTVPGIVSCWSIRKRAIPKSSTITRSSRPSARSRLLGLRSRCTTPCRWRPPRVPATRATTSTLSAAVSPRCTMRSASVSPESHSITRYGLPPAVRP